MNRIRMAEKKDAKEVNEIYRPYILNSAVTFEYDEVSDEEFGSRMREVLDKLPYLVCEVDGEIAGYAYAAPFRSRAAFGWDLETTVYVKEGYYRRNIASALYEALIEMAKEMGYVNLYALITDTNESSRKMHEAFGFEEVGLYPGTGYKFNQWWGLRVMCRQINERREKQPMVKNVHELSEAYLDQVMRKAEKLIRMI